MNQPQQNTEDKKDEPKKECHMKINFAQLLHCPAFLKIVEIKIDIVILILSFVVFTHRIEEEGSKFEGVGAFMAYISCVALSTISSIVLFCIYVILVNSNKNIKLKSWVIAVDLLCGIFMLIAFMLHLYLLIKWELNRKSEEDESIPYLDGMIVISCLTFTNAIMYFMTECA